MNEPLLTLPESSEVSRGRRVSFYKMLSSLIIFFLIVVFGTDEQDIPIASPPWTDCDTCRPFPELNS